MVSSITPRPANDTARYPVKAGEYRAAIEGLQQALSSAASCRPWEQFNELRILARAAVMLAAVRPLRHDVRTEARAAALLCKATSELARPMPDAAELRSTQRDETAIRRLWDLHQSGQVSLPASWLDKK